MNIRALYSGGTLFLLLTAQAMAEGLAAPGWHPFLQIGQRVDSLDWNIAGSSVNVLSELRWSSLRSTSLQAGGRYAEGGWVILADGGFARVDAGSNRDSDYNGNNRTLEFSRSENAGGGLMYDYNFGFGKAVWSAEDAAWPHEFRVLAGYSQHWQDLSIFNGRQIIPAAVSGPIPGLQNSYRAAWQGPWLGGEFEAAYAVYSVRAGLKYHLVDYSAVADWNLRTDLQHPKSFRHAAAGSGLDFDLALSRKLSRALLLNVSWNIREWRAQNGIDETFYADGSRGDLPLNAVNWYSSKLAVGIECHLE